MDDKIQQIIQPCFAACEQTLQASQTVLPPMLARAAQAMVASLSAGNKIMTCGNGGSAADSQHFAAELVNRFECERRALPAIALTTDTSNLTSIANDSAYEEIFARQVEALGQPGDILLGITTSGHSENICRAVKTAQQRGIKTIALAGGDGGELGRLLRPDDVEIRVPATNTARVQEMHLLCMHCLCAVIDQAFGDD